MVDTSSYPNSTSLGAALDPDHSFGTEHPHLPATSNEGSLGGLSVGIPPDTTEFIGELFDPNTEIVIPNDDGVSSTAPEPQGQASFHTLPREQKRQTARPSNEGGLPTAAPTHTSEKASQDHPLPTGGGDPSKQHEESSCIQNPCARAASLVENKSSSAGTGQPKQTEIGHEAGAQLTMEVALPSEADPHPSSDFQTAIPTSNASAANATISPQLLGEDLHGMWNEDHPGAPYGGDEGELIPNPLGRFDDVNGWDAENIQLEAYSSTDTSCGLDGAGNRGDGDADAEVEGQEQDNDSGEVPAEASQKQKTSKSKPIVQCTRDLYFSFKAHLEEQARQRQQRVEAQRSNGASTGGAGDRAKLKVPVVGKVLQHAASTLWEHVKGNESRLTALLEAFRTFQTTRKTKNNTSVERVGARLPEEVVPLLAEALQIGKPVTESWGLKRFMVDFLLVCAMGKVSASPMLVDMDMLDELEKKRAEHVAQRTNQSRQRRQQWRKEQQQRQALEGTERAPSGGAAAAAVEPAGAPAVMAEGYASEHGEAGCVQVAEGAEAGGGAARPHHGAMNLQHLGEREVHAWPTMMPHAQAQQYGGEADPQQAVEHPPPTMAHDMLHGSTSVGVLQPVAVAPQMHDASHYWDMTATVAMQLPVGDQQVQHQVMHGQAHLPPAYGGAPPGAYSGQADQSAQHQLQGAGMHVTQATQPPQQHMQHAAQQQGQPHMQQQQAQPHMQQQQQAQPHMQQQQGQPHMQQQQGQPHMQQQQAQPHMQAQQQAQHGMQRQQQPQQAQHGLQQPMHQVQHIPPPQHMQAQVFAAVPGAHMADMYAAEPLQGAAQAMPQQQAQPYGSGHFMHHPTTQPLHQQPHPPQHSMQQITQVPQMAQGMHMSIHSTEPSQQGGAIPAATPPGTPSGLPAAFKQPYPASGHTSGQASPMHSQQHAQQLCPDAMYNDASDMHGAEQPHSHAASPHAPVDGTAVNLAGVVGAAGAQVHGVPPVAAVDQSAPMDSSIAMGNPAHEGPEQAMQQPDMWTQQPAPQDIHMHAPPADTVLQGSLPAGEGAMQGTMLGTHSACVDDPGMPQQHVEQGLQAPGQLVEHPTGTAAAAEGAHEAPHPSDGPWEAAPAPHTHQLQDQADQADDVKPLVMHVADGDRQAGPAVAANACVSAAQPASPPAQATASADPAEWGSWHGTDAAPGQVMYAATDQGYDAGHSDARQPDGGQNVAAAAVHQMSPPAMAADTSYLADGDGVAQADMYADTHQQHQPPQAADDQPLPSAAHAQPPQPSQAPGTGMHATGSPSVASTAAAPAVAPEGSMAAGALPGGQGTRPGKRSRPAGAVAGQPPPSRITRSTAHATHRAPPAAGTVQRRSGPHISDGTAATILVALQSGTNPPQRPAPRRQSRTTADDVPTFTTSEAAAEARTNIEGERDALFLALRRNVPNAASKLQLSPLSVTQHVLKVVCTLQVHDTYLTKEGVDETVTQLNIPVPATRGPAVELPTFRLARGNREGMMLVTMLICYVNVANIKKSQADPPQDIRTRVKKDIMVVLAIIMRHLPRLHSQALPTLTTEDASSVAQLNYANELRSYVTFCRLLQAWRTDPHIRPQLDRLTNPRNLPPRPPPPPNSAEAAEVARTGSLPSGGLQSPPGANGAVANGVSPSAPTVNGGCAAVRPAAKGASPMLSPSSSGNGGDGTCAAGATTEAQMMTATSAGDTRCLQPQAAAAAPGAAGGGGGGAASYDSRKVMLAQLIADQVREKTSAIASITTLSDQMENIMSGSGASGTLSGMITGVEERLKALQEECDRLKNMSKTVVEELGEGADQNQLHVVLGKLAASTERMNDDVAYLVIGAKTMISETLLHDLFPDVFS